MQASSINLDALLAGKHVTPFGSNLRCDDFQCAVAGRPLASLIQLRLRGPETLVFARRFEWPRIADVITATYPATVSS
ncbi:MAG: hypothetical protein HYX63_01045 [Gammaproteobacteria bacterium]|nr:hypothetical protein [Gammaproteobacteria bacterium]